MYAVSVASELALRAFPGLLFTKWKHVAAMTAPVRAHVGKGIEAMWDAVIDLLFVRIRVCIGFADTFGDNFRIAILVTGVLAILALHASRIFEEITT